MISYKRYKDKVTKLKVIKVEPLLSRFPTLVVRFIDQRKRHLMLSSKLRSTAPILPPMHHSLVVRSPRLSSHSSIISFTCHHLPRSSSRRSSLSYIITFIGHLFAASSITVFDRIVPTGAFKVTMRVEFRLNDWKRLQRVMETITTMDGANSQGCSLQRAFLWLIEL